jgi:hypothetical protein
MWEVFALAQLQAYIDTSYVVPVADNEFMFQDYILSFTCPTDLLCGLMVIIPGCWSRGPEFDSRGDQILWVAMGLERGSLSPCEDKWGATWKKSSGSGLENWD